MDGSYVYARFLCGLMNDSSVFGLFVPHHYFWLIKKSD